MKFLNIYVQFLNQLTSDRIHQNLPIYQFFFINIR